MRTQLISFIAVTVLCLALALPAAATFDIADIGGSYYVSSTVTDDQAALTALGFTGIPASPGQYTPSTWEEAIFVAFYDLGLIEAGWKSDDWTGPASNYLDPAGSPDSMLPDGIPDIAQLRAVAYIMDNNLDQRVLNEGEPIDSQSQIYHQDLKDAIAEASAHMTTRGWDGSNAWEKMRVIGPMLLLLANTGYDTGLRTDPIPDYPPDMDIGPTFIDYVAGVLGGGVPTWSTNATTGDPVAMPLIKEMRDFYRWSDDIDRDGRNGLQEWNAVWLRYGQEGKLASGDFNDDGLAAIDLDGNSTPGEASDSALLRNAMIDDFVAAVTTQSENGEPQTAGVNEVYPTPEGLADVPVLVASSGAKLTEVDLNWTAVSGVTDYAIYRVQRNLPEDEGARAPSPDPTDWPSFDWERESQYWLWSADDDFDGVLEAGEMLAQVNGTSYTDTTAANEIWYVYWVVPILSSSPFTLGTPSLGDAGYAQFTSLGRVPLKADYPAIINLGYTDIPTAPYDPPNDADNKYVYGPVTWDSNLFTLMYDTFGCGSAWDSGDWFNAESYVWAVTDPDKRNPRLPGGMPNIVHQQLMGYVMDNDVDLSASGGVDHADVKEAFAEASDAVASYGFDPTYLLNADFWGGQRHIVPFYIMSTRSDDFARTWFDNLANQIENGDADPDDPKPQNIKRFDLADFPKAVAQRDMFAPDGDADNDGVSNLREWNAVWLRYGTEGKLRHDTFMNKDIAVEDLDGDGRINTKSTSDIDDSRLLRRAMMDDFIAAALDDTIIDDGSDEIQPTPDNTARTLSWLAYSMPFPANFAVTQGTFEDRVRLTWDAVPNATNYAVFRIDGSEENWIGWADTNENGSFTEPEDAGEYTKVTGTVYEDEGIVQGHEYRYWVAAVFKASGRTLFSAPARSQIGYAEPPPPDTDGDGLLDRDEDTNENGIWEPELGETDWQNADSDGDGVGDGVEVSLGYDPLDGTDFPVLPAAGFAALALLMTACGGVAAYALRRKRD